MRVWGYTSGSFCIVLGLLSLVLTILLFVIAKSDAPLDFKNNSVGFAAVVLVLAVVAMIMGGVTLWKIYLANQLYLRVSSEAALGKISVGPSPRVAPPPVATMKTTTTTQNPAPPPRALPPPSQPNPAPSDDNDDNDDEFT